MAVTCKLKESTLNGTISHTPSTDVTKGDVVVFGSVVGIAERAISANEVGALAIRGVYQMPKATTSGSAITAGALVYWDASSEVVTTTAGSNKKIGFARAASADSTATVEVILQPLD